MDVLFEVLRVREDRTVHSGREKLRTAESTAHPRESSGEVLHSFYFCWILREDIPEDGRRGRAGHEIASSHVYEI